ncbi:PREDICTED: uncharacterized protein LOC106146751 [Chinchilla lanigera]|uniref:uncharacterized protein LOC106146751 n=1 Tax=Chinchilla lanigera TaxID=34839 RepID=UPI0006968B80|nr:PREDICTED: uncharacterized protein LOC106146751 [Chinchilla lanigera]
MKLRIVGRSLSCIIPLGPKSLICVFVRERQEKVMLGHMKMEQIQMRPQQRDARSQETLAETRVHPFPEPLEGVWLPPGLWTCGLQTEEATQRVALGQLPRGHRHGSADLCTSDLLLSRLVFAALLPTWPSTFPTSLPCPSLCPDTQQGPSCTSESSHCGVDMGTDRLVSRTEQESQRYPQIIFVKGTKMHQQERQQWYWADTHGQNVGLDLCLTPCTEINSGLVAD